MLYAEIVQRGYMPLVIGLTNVAVAVDVGPLQPIWDGFAPTVGLQYPGMWDAEADSQLEFHQSLWTLHGMSMATIECDILTAPRSFLGSWSLFFRLF